MRDWIEIILGCSGFAGALQLLRISERVKLKRFSAARKTPDPEPPPSISD